MLGMTAMIAAVAAAAAGTVSVAAAAAVGVGAVVKGGQLERSCPQHHEPAGEP